MLRNSVSAIGLGLLASPLLIAGQVVSASAQTTPTVTFSASPASIPNGQSSTLSWASANATACSGTGKGFSPSGASGSIAVSPHATTTYGVTCTGAGGSASQSVAVTVTAAAQLTIGMTVAAAGTSANPSTTWVYSTPTTGTSAIGSEAAGNQGVVIGGPVSNSYTWWQVAFDDDLTGWASQGGLAPATPSAPTLTFSAYPPSVGPGASSTLTWTSTNATSCSGTGFSASGASGSSLVSPTVSANYSITCTGSGGSTAQSASVVVNPVPQFTWSHSLPVTFNAPGIVQFGGTEARALVFMDGSLYAGIGDWMDPNVGQTGVNAAQVLRLDSPTGSWVQDQNFLAAAARKTGVQEFLAIGAMQMAHFDHDSNKNAITPVDVLMTGFWNLNVSGLEVGQKTVTTGSSGAQGTWAVNTLVAPPAASAQSRALTGYTDSVTGVEMAFAGGDQYGIFSGAFNAGTNAIQWGANAEANSATLVQNATYANSTNSGRVISFASCGGHLYASIFNTIVMRTDGANPSWSLSYTYPGGASLPNGTSGFRGLTCVAQPTGTGYMLISALEGTGDIYAFQLNDMANPTIELNTLNYLSTQIGAATWNVIAAYNDMIAYPGSGTQGHPDLIIGLGIINAPNYPFAWGHLYPNPTFLVRHANGTYDFQPITPPSGAFPISTRTIAVSQFPGDPAGTIYAGGYDARGVPNHNTDWVYRGIPTNPLGQVAKH